MVTRLFILVFILALPCARAWLDPTNYYDRLNISFVNDKNTGPTAENTAPEAGTTSLPFTVRCSVSPVPGATIMTVGLQYRHSGDAVWHELAPSYIGPAWTIDFRATQTAFGDNQITATECPPGDTVLIRVWATDGLTENASVLVDTAADGTNGWRDEWVVSITAHATNTKPGMPEVGQ